ncbi:hypothetical protein [Acinetobacter larvae]|uniref:hypothetical protein n=1 Tax=Acinetobacter larvae TaxID=1789224 RepID=UPI0012FE78C2|nr:hypothetical protein [Acinetobacter larvae]
MKTAFYQIAFSLLVIVLVLLLQQIDLRYQFKTDQTPCPKGTTDCHRPINPEFLN